MCKKPLPTPKVRSFVLGRIDYEDAENKYWTTVCWYYDRVLSALAAWSGCNDEGSQKKNIRTDKTRMLQWANIIAASLAAVLWLASACVKIPDLMQTAMTGKGSITHIMRRQSILSALAAFCTAISVAILAYMTAVMRFLFDLHQIRGPRAHLDFNAVLAFARASLFTTVKCG
jgi:hypothetical protein